MCYLGVCLDTVAEVEKANEVVHSCLESVTSRIQEYWDSSTTLHKPTRFDESQNNYGFIIYLSFFERSAYVCKVHD
jgi:hypothetical protein